MPRPSGYRAHALGQVSPPLCPHAAYLVLGAAGNARGVAYLFRRHLDDETISGMRLALIP